MKKKLIIYFPKDSWNCLKHPYEGIGENVETKQIALLDVLPSHINIYIARGINSHIWDNTFQPQFIRNSKIWSPYTWSLIHADLVIGFNLPKSVTKIFNTIREITQDKTILEKLFPKYVIPSLVCNNYDEIKNYFNTIPTKLKVLKPVKWTRSRWIFIQENIPNKDDIVVENYPYLLQEFFDTSWGFYGYLWIHDFRVIMLWWRVIWKFLRQPEIGKYTANSFRKWWLIDLLDWKIPEEIQKIIDEIENYCSKRFLHRYYSIDFWVWKNWEIKIFEMNSAPGLTNKHIAKSLWEYISKNILKVS